MKLSRYEKLILYFSLAVIVFALIMKIFLISHSVIGFDEAGTSYIAKEIASGKSLYIDYFDHKPPFMHYLLSLFYLFIEPTNFNIKLIALIFDSLLLLTIFFVSMEFTDRIHSLLAAAAYSVYNLSLSLNTEIIMSVFGLIGFLFYSKALKKDNLANFNLFVAGIMIAIAIWFKQSAVFFYLPIVLHIGYMRYKKQISTDSMIKSASLFTLGVLVVSVPLLSYFLYAVGKEFLYAIIFFNLEFEAASSGIFQLGKGLNILLSSMGFLMAIIIPFILFNKEKKGADKRITALLFMNILILFFIMISPEIFYQHFFQVFPFAILLTVISIYKSGFEKKKIMISILFIGILAISLASLELNARQLRENPLEKNQEIMDYLNQNVPVDSSFFSDNAIYTLLGDYSLREELVNIAPAFASVYEYSFICDKDYLVLTHRQGFLSEKTKECINNNFVIKKRFDGIGESYVEILESKSISA